MTAALVVQDVSTSGGPARLHIDRAVRPRRVLALGHGAGGGVGAPDLLAIAARLSAASTTVVRFEQPWRVAGRSVAVAPLRLDDAWLDGLAALPPDLRGLPLLVGGRSAGARVACRTAASVGAVGVLGLAFPLHPPGRPERSRLPELLGVHRLTRVVQGERDPFGGPAEFPVGLDVVGVPGADHAFGVGRAGPLSARESIDFVVDAVAAWVAGMPGA